VATSPLVVEVAAHLSVIPKLNEQLAETSQQVERAVVDVCAHFQSIADKARRGVEATNALVEGGHGDSFGTLLERMQDTMRAMDRRLTRTADRSLQAIARLEQLEASLSGVFRNLDQIEELATALRLLAINAKIEAVRSGDRGSGFAVVADEMQRAGKESRAIAEQIRDGVAHMTTETSELASLLREGAQSDLASIEASRTQVADTSEALAKNHRTLHTRIVEGAELSHSLAEEISAAVIGLQFQDRVNQRIGHVTHALTQMRDALGHALPAVDDDSGEAREERQALVEQRLHETYTMWEERQDEAPSSGDVELF
jgi:methyl-accepting chemotaxis protein